MEGSLPSETLEDDGAEGPEVGLGVVLQGHDDLGRHVHRGPAQGGRHHAVLQESRETKICNLQDNFRGRRVPGPPTVRQEDVLRLEVPVDDPLAVHGHHGSS